MKKTKIILIVQLIHVLKLAELSSNLTVSKYLNILDTNLKMLDEVIVTAE